MKLENQFSKFQKGENYQISFTFSDVNLDSEYPSLEVIFFSKKSYAETDYIVSMCPIRIEKRIDCELKIFEPYKGVCFKFETVHRKSKKDFLKSIKEIEIFYFMQMGISCGVDTDQMYEIYKCIIENLEKGI